MSGSRQIVKWSQKKIDVFLRAVDSGQVKIFQAIVYFWVIVSGAYMLWYGSGPSVIETELSPLMHDLWVWLILIGPLLSLIGDTLVRIGAHELSSGSGGGKRIYWGWYLQFGGDSVVAMVFMAYVIASFQAAWLSRGIFAAFVVTALMVCAFVLALRDLRNLRIIEKMRDD